MRHPLTDLHQSVVFCYLSIRQHVETAANLSHQSSIAQPIEDLMWNIIDIEVFRAQYAAVSIRSKVCSAGLWSMNSTLFVQNVGTYHYLPTYYNTEVMFCLGRFSSQDLIQAFSWCILSASV